MDAPVAGMCDPRFASVKDEFARNFAERGEVGAAVCVMVDGATVVDLAGGWRDEGRTEPWQPDTLVDFYSVGKAFLAVLALQLVDAGLIGLDDPVASVWPEFAAGGKEAATLRHALCHRAAVPAIREPLTNDDLWDWGRMTGALAATERVVGARHAARLPHQHLRPPDRRGGPPGQRRDVRTAAGRPRGSAGRRRARGRAARCTAPLCAGDLRRAGRRRTAGLRGPAG